MGGDEGVGGGLPQKKDNPRPVYRTEETHANRVQSLLEEDRGTSINPSKPNFIT